MSLTYRSTGKVLDLYGGASTTWTDHSVHGNDGTLTGGPTRTTLANGLEVINFDADAEYVSVTSHASIETAGALTIMLWMIPDMTYDSGLAENDYVLYKQNVTNEERYVLLMRTTGKLTFQTEENNNNLQYLDSTTTSWTSGTAYFITATWDSTNGKILYVDAVAENTDAGETTLLNAGTQTPLSIGGLLGQAGFKGSIYRPRIHTYAFSAAQVARVYQRERGLLGV